MARPNKWGEEMAHLTTEGEEGWLARQRGNCSPDIRRARRARKDASWF